MCTVTYLPKKNGDFILTSSRDESTSRPPALAPDVYNINGKNILFPKDPTGGGSWIAYAENRVACLLNGAFKKHIHTPPYKKSRGLILLDYFSFESVSNFTENYDFKGIEPFTLIIIEKNTLTEIRWDENKITATKYPFDKPAIWSSTPLYTEKVIAEREAWFKNWLNENEIFTTDNIKQFHFTAGNGDIENNILMNRHDLLRTVSITIIEKTGFKTKMRYEDIVNKSIISKELANS